jgi:hypothetical protein
MFLLSYVSSAFARQLLTVFATRHNTKQHPVDAMCPHSLFHSCISTQVDYPCSNSELHSTRASAVYIPGYQPTSFAMCLVRGTTRYATHNLQSLLQPCVALHNGFPQQKSPGYDLPFLFTTCRLTMVCATGSLLTAFTAGPYNNTTQLHPSP